MKTAISKEAKLHILGDFNVCNVKDHEIWDAISHFEIQKVNSNGFRLLEL